MLINTPSSQKLVLAACAGGMPEATIGRSGIVVKPLTGQELLSIPP